MPNLRSRRAVARPKQLTIRRRLVFQNIPCESGTATAGSMNGSRVPVLAGSPRIELRTERKSLFQVLDEDAHFRGDPAACRPNRHDRHVSLIRRQETKNSAFA